MLKRSISIALVHTNLGKLLDKVGLTQTSNQFIDVGEFGKVKLGHHLQSGNEVRIELILDSER